MILVFFLLTSLILFGYSLRRGVSCYIFNNITKSSEMINNVFRLYNMTVEVLENAHKTNCTKAVFKGSPKHLSKSRWKHFIWMNHLWTACLLFKRFQHAATLRVPCPSVASQEIWTWMWDGVKLKKSLSIILWQDLKKWALLHGTRSETFFCLIY